MAVALPKILLFISSRSPLPYDRQLAATVAAPVQYRNIREIADDAVPEECDGVMGVVIPGQYKSKPTGKQAMDTYRAALAKDASAKPVPLVQTTIEPTPIATEVAGV